jgi:hypothetical protein
MKKILLTMAFVLTALGNAWADDVTVSDITVPKGGKATLEISLENSKDYRQLFQFLLELPDGITVVENSEELNEERFNDKAVLEYEPQSVAGTYQFICTAGKDVTSISGTSGVIVRVKLAADKDKVEVGDVLSGKISGIEVTDQNSKAFNPTDKTFSITIDSRFVLDENDKVLPDARNGIDVCVLRTIKANQWSTICLPFAMTETQVKAAFGDDVELADAVSYEASEDDDDNIIGLNIAFSSVTAIEANHPYVIWVSKAITSFNVDGVDVNPASKDSGRRVKLANKSYFIGNYLSDTNVPEFGIFMNGNKFWYSTGLTKIKGYRAYFDLDDILTEVEEAESRITFSFVDEATRITDINAKEVDNSIYNLSGQKVERLNKKGLYIKGGKKVVIK